jgi:hypothetical protein
MTGHALRAGTIDPADSLATGASVDKARFAVGYAILSLSSRNTQPWTFRVVADEFLPDCSRGRLLLEPFDRTRGSSCGIALLNLVCGRIGLPVETATRPQAAGPGLLARIGCPHGARLTMELNELFASDSARATNRIRQTREPRRLEDVLS